MDYSTPGFPVLHHLPELAQTHEFVGRGGKKDGVVQGAKENFPGGAGCKEPARQRRRLKIPELGRSPGGGHSNPLQYSHLENPMDRGAWWDTAYRFAKTQTQLK